MIDSFVAAVDAVAPAAAAVPVARRLLARWQAPERGYHDVRHLADMLDRLHELSHDDPACVLAAWYHDAVHTGRAGDDERASAELARAELTSLDVPQALVGQVSDLVVMTIEHRPSDDPHQQAVADADMAILAAAPGRYADYLAGVRQDFGAFDDATFAAGRRAFVRSTLERDRLFHTPHGHAAWEAVARANLTAELG